MNRIDPDESTRRLGLIARELVREEDLQGYEWTEVSVVFGFNSRGRVNEIYGLAYGPGDLETPIAPFSGSEGLLQGR